MKLQLPKVSHRQENWFFRPASKASLIGAYILAVIAILLHFL